MKKGLATREAIIGEASRQASRLGLEGVSLMPIAERLGLSKGGLFAHFKSKQALQIEVLEHAITRFKREVIAPSAQFEAPAQRLTKVFVAYLDWIRGSDEDGGCLFMTMAQEYDDRPGEIRDRLAASQKDWRAYLGAIVDDGVARGDFHPETASDQVAFELIGFGMAFQHASKLLDDPRAKSAAMAAYDRLLRSIQT